MNAHTPDSQPRPDAPPTVAHEAGGAPVDQLLQRLIQFATLSDALPDAGTTLGRMTREFFEASWQAASSGLLARSTRLRVEPLQPESPHVFRFEMDLAFKAQATPGAAVEDRPGPLRGTIRYRPDLFSADEHEPTIAVLLDPGQDLLHPNFSRQHGMLCIGDIPSGPFELEHLLEHLWCVLSYENLSTTDPAELGAAQYFAQHPEVLEDLAPAGPLY